MACVKLPLDHPTNLPPNIRSMHLRRISTCIRNSETSHNPLSYFHRYDGLVGVIPGDWLTPKIRIPTCSIVVVRLMYKTKSGWFMGRFHWKRTNEPIVEIYGFPSNGDALWLKMVRTGYYAVSYWHEDAWCWLERCVEPFPVAGPPFDLSEYNHIPNM